MKQITFYLSGNHVLIFSFQNFCIDMIEYYCRIYDISFNVDYYKSRSTCVLS